MTINQKQSTLLTRDCKDKQRFQTKHSEIVIKMNHRQLMKIDNYSNLIKDQCLMESTKCVNKMISLGIKLMSIR